MAVMVGVVVMTGAAVVGRDVECGTVVAVLIVILDAVVRATGDAAMGLGRGWERRVRAYCDRRVCVDGADRTAWSGWDVGSGHVASHVLQAPGGSGLGAALW